MKTRALTSSFILLFILFFSATTFAQKSSGADKEVKNKVNEAVEKLDDQFKLEKSKRDAIEDIFTEFYSEQQKLKNHIQGPASGLSQGLTSQSFQSVRKQNEALVTERDSKLKKELTEEQYKKWKSEIEPSLRSRRSK